MRRHTRVLLTAILLILGGAGRALAQAPTITSISPSSGPVGSSVLITGTNFGASQGSSTVSLNGTNATATSWSATSIVAVVPTGASSGLFSVTVGGQAANSTSFTVTALPSGWSDGDVGSVGVTGSASYANGTFTVKGAGQQVWGTADGFNYAYQSLSGDGTIIARVVSLQGTTYAQAGVMIRETLNAGSTNAYMAYQSNQSPPLKFFTRNSTGGSTSDSTTSGSLPYWVEVVRSSSTFTGYASYDRVNWTQVASVTISMAQNVYIGLAVSSDTTSSLATATFDNVSVSSSASPAPAITASATTGPVGSQVVLSGSNFGATQGSGVVTLNGAPVTINSWGNTSVTITVPSGATSGPLLVAASPSMDDSNYFVFTITSQPLPSGWLDQDIGQVGVAGTAMYSGGIFTLNGSGQYIWDVADQFHFAYQALSGDGTIIARVISAQCTTATQAGVMIRETLMAGSTNAYMAYQCNQNPPMKFYTRTSTGGSTSASTASGTLPYFVKLARSGSSFSGYVSADGVIWTQVGSTTTINMAQNVYIGLAVSGNTNSATASATFDDVSISTAAAPAPAITTLSPTAGVVGSQVVISGSGFGTTQGNSQALLNDAPLTINSWSSTSITATIPFTATPGYLVVSLAPSMNDSNTMLFSVATMPGWLDADVGSFGVAGSAAYANGTFTVKGSGDVFNTSDGFHFVFQSLPGDGSIVARVVSLQGSGTYPQAGVMIRETLTAGSTDAFMEYQPTNMNFLYRTTTGGSTSYATAAGSLPYWVKVVRSGSSFSGYVSPDGVSWTQVGATQTINMAQSVYIGLAVSSDDNSSLATATFDNVSFVAQDAATGTLAGTITKASDGSAVSDAQIQVTQDGFVQSTGTSGANGTYTVFNLNPGAYDIKVSASGFASSFSPTVFIRPSGITTLSLSLSAPGTLSGTVTQADGVTPIQGATVTASVGQLPASSATSGSNGSYSISLGAGNYTVQASASGFASSTQSASVTTNSTTTANFSLQTQGSGAGSYVYDPLGRLVGVVLQNGNTVIYNYDAVGNLLSIIRQSSSQLSILTFSPPRGPVGTTVTIYGTGFNSTPSQNTVSFNSTNATVLSATSTQLIVTVPTGATTGPISVTTSAGTVTSSSSFTVGN